MARQTPIHKGYTVLNGSATGTHAGRIDVWVEYALGEQSVSNNCTSVKAYFYAALNPSCSSASRNIRGLNAEFYVDDIPGTCVSDGAYDFSSADNVHELGRVDASMIHGSDGIKTLRFRGSFTTVSQEISGGRIDVSVTLPAIPRVSQIRATDACITGVSVVTVRRHNVGFTHCVRWEFAGLTGYLDGSGITDQETKLTAENLMFPIPESFFLQIPNAIAGKCVLTCVTYHGDQVIGSSNCTITLSVNPEQCVPVIEPDARDCNPETLALTGDPGVLVAGQSHVRCSCQAQAKHGASIVSVTAAGVPAHDGCVLNNYEAEQVMFTVTDSRGFAAIRPVWFSVVRYVPLTCNASVRRTDPTSGNAVLTLSGQCFSGSFGAQDNALRITVSTGNQTLELAPQVGIDHHYQATFTVSDLDYTQSHRLTVTAADALTGAEVTLTLPKGQPVFDWGEGDFRFHVPVTGNFLGTFQGAHLRTVTVHNTDQLVLQSRFSEFRSDVTARHSIFLFGSANGIAVHGLLTVHAMGAANWSGTEGVTASVLFGGQVLLTLPRVAWDTFTALSAETFEITGGESV